MDRINRYNSRYSRFPKEFEKSTVVEKTPDIPERFKDLLDLIYSTNPLTGLPQGDLAIYCSDKVNPEIKAFIESQLLHSVAPDSQLATPDQNVLNQFKKVITDDDIAKFSRKHDETSDEYAERLHSYLEEEKHNVAVQREMKRLKDLIKASNEE